MNFIELVSSVNKISIIAVVVTLGFLGYEFFSFKKEKKRREKPTIPSFNPNQQTPVIAQPAKIEITQKVETVKNTQPILMTIIFLIFATVISIIGFSLVLSPSRGSAPTQTPKEVVKVASSEGIRIYDSEWNAVSTASTPNIKPGDSIYIGIATIKDPEVKNEIDKARIKINEFQWKEEHEATEFDNEKNIFYTKYQIASEESALRIEAQLHSKVKGWLEE